MARVPDILYQGQPGATDTDLYVVAAGKKATITSVLAANSNASTKYFSLNLIQSGGGVAADGNIIAKMQKVVGTADKNGGGSWTMDFAIPLNTAGDKITGKQETAGAITVIIIGFEEAV